LNLARLPFTLTAGGGNPKEQNVLGRRLTRLKRNGSCLIVVLITELSIKEDGFTWRGHTVSLEQLKKAQAAAHFSIGSCSLYEPDQDLGRLVG
jgi:hypothetical protein